jgi:hypothetical protein
MSNPNTTTLPTLTLADLQASEAMLQASLQVFGFEPDVWDDIQSLPIQDITLAQL